MFLTFSLYVWLRVSFSFSKLFYTNFILQDQKEGEEFKDWFIFTAPDSILLIISKQVDGNYPGGILRRGSWEEYTKWYAGF